MSHASTKKPSELLHELLRVLELQKVHSMQQSPFVVLCERSAVQFEAEVAAVDCTQSKFVVRLQLNQGDARLFRELCNRLLPAIRV